MKFSKQVRILVSLLLSIILFSNFVSAINTCTTGYQVAKGGSATISCFSSTTRTGCEHEGIRTIGKYAVSYSGGASALFVPTRTQAEWNAFLSVYSSITSIGLIGVDASCKCTPGCREDDCDRCTPIQSECSKLCWGADCRGYNVWC